MHNQIFEKKENPVRKKPKTKPSLYAQLQTMGDTSRIFQDHPLKTVGVVITRICYICISKYLKKGHNSVRKGRIKIFSLYVQLRSMCDTPRRFKDHPHKNCRMSCVPKKC